ncbi:MAG: hypothetical protein ACYTGD_17820 [Planctomycetota bacterium]|jgi:hypothetical protein
MISAVSAVTIAKGAVQLRSVASVTAWLPTAAPTSAQHDGGPEEPEDPPDRGHQRFTRLAPAEQAQQNEQADRGEYQPQAGPALPAAPAPAARREARPEQASDDRHRRDDPQHRVSRRHRRDIKDGPHGDGRAERDGKKVAARLVLSRRDPRGHGDDPP